MDLDNLMQSSLDSLRDRLSKIKSRASAAILNSVKIDYYGTETPVSQVANISVQDARTIAVEPWDRALIDKISSAVLQTLALNPSNDGRVIRITLPMLTEERRLEFVKQAKKELEDTKVALRQIRQKANQSIKSSEESDDIKRSEENQVQKALDNYSKQAENIFDDKKREILNI